MKIDYNRRVDGKFFNFPRKIRSRVSARVNTGKSTQAMVIMVVAWGGWAKSYSATQDADYALSL